MQPRLFYDTHVVTNFEAWGLDPKNRDKARLSIVSADMMADRMFAYLSARRPHALHGSPTPGAYRVLLTMTEPGFRVVWDTAQRRLEPILREPPRLAATPQEPGGAIADEQILMVTLRTGERVALRAAAAKTVKLWERVLDENGL